MFVDDPAPRWKERNDIFMFYVFSLTKNVIFQLLLSCRNTYSLKSKYMFILCLLRWSADSNQPQVPCLAKNYSDDCCDFKAVPNTQKLNAKLSPCKSLCPPLSSPAHWSLIHHSMSMHNQSIFFSITAIECQCRNLFVIREPLQKSIFSLSPSLMNFIAK